MTGCVALGYEGDKQIAFITGSGGFEPLGLKVAYAWNSPCEPATAELPA